MKTLVYTCLTFILLSTASCKPTDLTNDPANDLTEQGVIKGRVVDSQGKPVANAEIVASNTDYYNKTSTGYTDASGYYRFKVPTGIAEGSYTVSGTVTVTYLGKKYTMALYEENSKVFSAYDGAVRNFVWRLTGKRTADSSDQPEQDKPLGATLEVHHEVDRVDWNTLELTLEPVGPLVDGSTGKKIVTTMPADGYRIYDVPLGQYKITARNKATGQPLGVTIKDSSKPYASSVTGVFSEANFQGDTNYEMLLLVNTL